MAAKKTNSDSDGDKKRCVPNAVKFTPMTAKQAQEASVRARNLRKQMRARLLQVAIDEGIDKTFAKALKQGDEDLLNLVEKASKLVGLDFAASEDAVQKMDIKSENENKNDTTVRFVLGKRPEPTPKE